jgi:hypothetical protein
MSLFAAVKERLPDRKLERSSIGDNLRASGAWMSSISSAIRRGWSSV